ncbi:MAG TPA: FCD domain-containing protein, partial [Ktedonobacterales bacterium]|nr:FCD domain-containing protein [Ktedonobacterales bacterium]
CAQNHELAPTLDRLTPKIRRLEVAQFGSLAGRRSVEQHAAIIAAVEGRDAALAANLVEQNWLSLGELILASLAGSAPQ